MRMVLFAAAVLTAVSCYSKSGEYKLADMLFSPEQRSTRLQGKIGEKADRFFYHRCWGPEARNVVFSEAEFAFTHPDDDVFNSPVGMWKGEFWGKLAISGARVAEYRNDDDYREFLRGSALRLMAMQRSDGYLGTYLDSEFIVPCSVEKAEKAIGWKCDWNWNLWCRKYTAWGLLAIYKTTGDKRILAAAEKAVEQQIRMLRDKGVKLCDTGTTAMCGLPPCSILKPLVLLYRETGNELFRDYAGEIVGYWSREGNPPPNFFVNCDRDTPIFHWYDGQDRKPTKMYELLSCLDGILEYYRLTGETRCLDCVRKIQANIWKYERNPLDSIGYNDNFADGARHFNGSTEPCDIIHWMRLNYDLYLLTGEVKYIDVIELAYYNAFQAAVNRDGKWGAREVRSHERNSFSFGQSGMRHQHCCVNNMPRGYMDVALANATTERETGDLRVNLYSDFTSDFGDCSVSVSGDFPYDSKAIALIRSSKPRKVKFRVPTWSDKVSFRVLPEGAVLPHSGRWCEVDVGAGITSVRIDFDMKFRLVDCAREACVLEKDSQYRLRWENYGKSPDLVGTWRKTGAARLYCGPLLLAKSRYWGESAEEVMRADMNGAGWKVVKARKFCDDRTNAAWEVEFENPATGERRRTRVCDFSSAADSLLPPYAHQFSIWF